MQKTRIIRLSKLRSQQCNSFLSGHIVFVGSKLSNDKYFREFVCMRLCGFHVPIGTDRRHTFYDCRPKLCCKVWHREFVRRTLQWKCIQKTSANSLPSFNQTGMCAKLVSFCWQVFGSSPFGRMFDAECCEAFDSKIDLTLLLIEFFDTFRLGLHVRAQTMTNGTLDPRHFRPFFTANFARWIVAM